MLDEKMSYPGLSWERPLYISELHSGLRGSCQKTAKGFIKDLPSVPTGEYLSKIK